MSIRDARSTGFDPPAVGSGGRDLKILYKPRIVSIMFLKAALFYAIETTRKRFLLDFQTVNQ